MDQTHSEENLIACPGCRAVFAASDSPTHQYIDASPGCWSVFMSVLGREYEHPASPDLRQLTVDAYAVQHPGNESPQTLQSVHTHLLGLCLSLEHAMPARRVVQLIRANRRNAATFTWLTPPESRGSLTILDVTGADTAADHAQRVRTWAQSVWHSWQDHHAHVHAIATHMLDG